MSPMESLFFKKTRVHHPFQMQRSRRKCRRRKSVSEVQATGMGLISDCLSLAFAVNNHGLVLLQNVVFTFY